MSAADAVLAAAILAGAVLLLVRSLLRGGACHGCDGGACRRGRDLVRLRGPAAPRGPLTPGGSPRPARRS